MFSLSFCCLLEVLSLRPRWDLLKIADKLVDDFVFFAFFSRTMISGEGVLLGVVKSFMRDLNDTELFVFLCKL